MKTPLPSFFAVKPPGPYAFKSPLKRALVHGMDALGSLLMQPPRKPIDWLFVQRVAVLRLDHLGDVLLTLPALKALREELPRAQIDFITGPWGLEAAKMGGQADRVLVFEAPWFARPARAGVWGATEALSRLLRAGGYDAVIDFRGDLRHAWAARKAGIPLRIGQALTGGRFLLTHPARYYSNLHEIEQNISLLRQAGLFPRALPSWPVFKAGEEDTRTVEKVKRELGLGENFIVLHPLPATPAKRWMAEKWGQLIDGLPGDFDVVMIGVQTDAAYLEEIQKGCRRKVISAAGLFTLPQLAAFLGQCRLFIGVDSGPAHIAAAVGVPVISLFSGTNRVCQWAPWGSQVTVLQKETECSPCELQECPFGNECMRRIEVGEVLSLVKPFL